MATKTKESSFSTTTSHKIISLSLLPEARTKLIVTKSSYSSFMSIQSSLTSSLIRIPNPFATIAKTSSNLQQQQSKPLNEILNPKLTSHAHNTERFDCDYQYRRGGCGGGDHKRRTTTWNRRS
jgi:hypothetical protein